MNLELHIIQNFAPSNLNRDDTGSPKSCEFGGYRRARISSQCIKRAIRTAFQHEGLVPAANRAERSKRFVGAIAERLTERGRDGAEAHGVAEAALSTLNIRLADDEKTQYLLYFGAAEVDAIANFCDERWDTLSPLAQATRGAKKGAQDQAAKDLGKQLERLLDGGRAVDLALFGRMLADLPERNIDAASQVAHAISTHAVTADFDYYTAVDDRKPDDTAGADMIGTVEFNSACYYRYANVDLGQLRENLGGDAELTEAAVRAFLVASRDAIPTGKQNSFAARNLPSFIFAVVRPGGAWSLANAFVRPVRPSCELGLVEASVKELDRHWGQLVQLYGAPEGMTFAACGLGALPLEHLKPAEVMTFAELQERILGAVHAGLAG